MVKVARLLPSKDLLSSHRQLRWTHTLVLPIVGLDIETIDINNIAAFVSSNCFPIQGS